LLLPLPLLVILNAVKDLLLPLLREGYGL
jgi:hypothetical protein